MLVSVQRVKRCPGPRGCQGRASALFVELPASVDIHRKEKQGMHDSLKKSHGNSAVPEGNNKNIIISLIITHAFGKYFFNWLTWAFLTTTSVS
jgi:hypothetical protein